MKWNDWVFCITMLLFVGLSFFFPNISFICFVMFGMPFLLTRGSYKNIESLDITIFFVTFIFLAMAIYCKLSGVCGDVDPNGALIVICLIVGYLFFRVSNIDKEK